MKSLQRATSQITNSLSYEAQKSCLRVGAIIGSTFVNQGFSSQNQINRFRYTYLMNIGSEINFVMQFLSVLDFQIIAVNHG